MEKAPQHGKSTATWKKHRNMEKAPQPSRQSDERLSQSKEIPQVIGVKGREQNSRPTSDNQSKRDTTRQSEET
jgi:hypothetical protein